MYESQSRGKSSSRTELTTEKAFLYNHTDQARSVKAYKPYRPPPRLCHFLQGGSKFWLPPIHLGICVRVGGTI